MPGFTSAWRTNDVVTYDTMRAAANRLAAALVAEARHTDRAARQARAELAQLRQDVANVDGYDRAAVLTLRDRIEAQLHELEDRGQ